MVSAFQKCVNINFKVHLAFSLAIRFLLIMYGIYHDQNSAVKYTDVDYKVFTDASRHILNGQSPYNRHTYRYTPLIALLVLPNLTLHHSYGKILFSVIDLCVAVLIRFIVKNNLKEYECYKQKIDKIGQNEKKIKYLGYKNKKKYRPPKKHSSKNNLEFVANLSMLVWLYNPMTVAIGTRGNCDSLAGLLVLITLYFLQCKRQYFIAGLFHGVSIHFRLYPIIYSLTMFMFLSKFSMYTTEDRREKNQCRAIENNCKKQIKNLENSIVKNNINNSLVEVSNINKLEKKTIFKKEYFFYLVPNLDQVKLISGTVLSLCILTSVFYLFYGYKFLYETYIYHFIRKDTRHNFSLYFYLLYLTAWVKNIGIWQNVLITLPQVVLLLVFSVRYGLNKFSLNFSILLQTIVMVIYNKVLTSQYFVWVMAILPLCLWQIRMPLRTTILLIVLWYAAQGAWLLPAYFLEFEGHNTFFLIWLQSVSLFCANIAILGRLIMYFMPVDKVKST